MSQSEVSEFFSDNADEYQAGLKEGSEEKLNFVKETVGDEIGGKILDVGCGSATFADRMMEKPDTEYVVGTEITKEMFSIQSTNVDLLLSDAENLPFRSGVFGAIHMDTVLHHIVGGSRTESIKKGKKVFSELFRVLESGGYILLTERIQRGRFLADKRLSYGIFYALKYGSELLHPLHPQIHKDQPPICFYTFEEISSLVEDAGGDMVNKDIFSHPSSHPLVKPFQSMSLRVTFYIKKESK